MIIPTEQYNQILKTMPIPCVDLLVVDKDGNILLVKRANEPAKGQWWFPGGRVYYKETRHGAAIRKLKEECGLDPVEIKELGTFDVMLENPTNSSIAHGITTLFCMRISSRNGFQLDNQGIAFNWKSLKEWENIPLHEFVRHSFKFFLNQKTNE
jgi:colanic acid biosynthesis protein WcaH